MSLSRDRASALAFLAAFSALFLQVLVHRMVSAKLLNNYAFLVISLTMLGFAAAGVVLSFKLRGVLARLSDSVGLASALFALSALSSARAFYATQTSAAFGISRPSFVASFFEWIPFALALAVPFACCGFVLGALLAAPELPTRRVYFFDLVGSGAGAFAVLPAISLLGVERSLLLVAALMPLGAAFLAAPCTRLTRAATLVAILGCGLLAMRAETFFAMRYPPGSVLAMAQEKDPQLVVEHVRWDPLARIEVSRIPPPDPENNLFASLLGENRRFLGRFRRMLTQNNYAYTYALDYDGQLASLTGIEETLYAAAYQAKAVAAPRVVVIGVGGGFDILNALYFGAREITGVEVNGAVLEILTHDYQDYFRHWVDDPRVRLVHDEGRHFLAGNAGPFDVIQLSGVDSYSGTPGAAHVFSENYLYTIEAFRLYLSRLTEQGLIHMMRLERKPPREMLRALVTAVAALRLEGVLQPADHIVTLSARTGTITSLLVKKTPFNPEERRRLSTWCSGSGHFVVSSSPDPSSPGPSAYESFLARQDPAAERTFVVAYPFDIEPTEDDRPFFFQFSFWWHVFPADPLVWSVVPVMQYSLILLGLAIGAATLITVWLPLRQLSRGRRRPPHAWRYALFFAAAGSGYMAIEIALLQKFGLFLGHPSYALSIVLAALLVSSGLGSLGSDRIVPGLGGIRFVAYALCGVVLAEVLVLLPMLKHLDAAPHSQRVAVALLLVTPIGLLLGTFVPTGIERLKQTSPSLVPWAWGINGVFSVLAPIFSVAVSITWGITLLLVSALPVYLLAGFGLPAPGRR